MAALCLHCRTLMTDARCDLCGRKPVDLLDEAGRARLEEAAWRTSVERQPRDGLFVLGGLVFGVGGLVALIAVTIVSVKQNWGIFPAEIIGGTVLWTASWLLVAWLPALFPKTVTTRAARGVERLKMPRGEALVGRVVGAPGDPPSAWAVEVCTPTTVTFRAAESLGFELETEDGVAILVPAGRARVVLPVEPSKDVARRIRRRAIPDEIPGRGWPLDDRTFDRVAPGDRIWLWTSGPGDVLRLWATVEDEIDEGSGYRSATVSRRRVVGLPWMAAAE